MATATVTALRRAAERCLSDAEVAQTVAALAFELEDLVDAGPFGVPPGGAPRALDVARKLETLAGETATQRPTVARALRTAAADLRRGAEASGPREAFLALSDGLRLLEQL